MKQDLIPYITQAGLQAALDAHRQEIAARITTLVLGDSGYAPPLKNGYCTATALRQERQRVVIANGRRISDHQIELSALVEGNDAYEVRELGFYLEDGTLFALWSNPQQALAWKSDKVPLIIALELAFAALPANSVTVQNNGAPLELLLGKELAIAGTAVTNLQIRQLQQQDEIQQLRQKGAQARAELDMHKLDVNAKAKDSVRLNGALDSANADPNTIVKRDGAGHVHARLFRSWIDPQGNTPGENADVAFRNDKDSDNYIRFMTKGALQLWLGLDQKIKNAIDSVKNWITDSDKTFKGKNTFAQGVYAATSSGHVGVGTANPEGKLQIINANQNWEGNTLILGPRSQSNLRLGYHQDFSWIQSHGRKPLGINPAGNNVGIGTGANTPAERLEVNGRVKSKAFIADKGETLCVQDKSDAINSDSNSTVATSKAVKQVNDAKLDKNAKAVDSAKLNGLSNNAGIAANSIAQRDSAGDLHARLFRSNYGEQSNAPSSSADIAFRNNKDSDNYIRFMTKSAMQSWLGFSHKKNNAGYVVLPGGIIFQWKTGIARSDDHGKGGQTITFPIAFPNACRAAFVTSTQSSTSQNANLVHLLVSKSKTNCVVVTDSTDRTSGTITPVILAIGD